jgi:hypothetical protein
MDSRLRGNDSEKTQNAKIKSQNCNVKLRGVKPCDGHAILHGNNVALRNPKL